MIRTSALIAAAAAGVCGAQALGQSYFAGHEWNRQNDFQAGLAQGTSQGNPSPDGAGMPVWSYEWAAGGALGSGNEWFAQAGTEMVWNSNWHGIGQGAWARGLNVNPPVFQNRLTHNLHASAGGAAPMVRWINPLGGAAELDIAGSLRVQWSGHQFVGAPTDVDVVIAAVNPGGGSTVLFGTTVSKPTPSLSVGDELTLPVSLQDVNMGAGESLVVSLRGRDQFTGDGRWVVMHDNLTLTLVPSPGPLALIGLGTLVAFRRRR